MPTSIAFRVLVLTLLQACSAGASEAIDAFPPTQIFNQLEHYTITGTSMDQIDAQLIEHAERFENPGNATTRSRFEINKTLLQRPDHCEITAIRIRVTITTLLPLWQPERRVAETLRARWIESSEILQRHEDGHRRHALAAAGELRARLLGLLHKRSSMALDAMIGLELQTIVQGLDLRDARYDARTGNGLRDDPLIERPPGTNPELRSRKPPRRADQTVLDFFNRQ